jgi:hypothetical protein
MSDPRLRVIQRGDDADEASILDVLDGRTIVVRLPNGPLAWAHEVLAVALVDLLGRVFSRIRIDAEPEVATRLFEPLRAHGTPPLPHGEADLTIAVGAHGERADLHVAGAAWQSYLGTEPSRLDPAHEPAIPVGPLLAAARGAAHAFSFLMRDHGVRHAPPASTYTSVLGHRVSSDPLDDPDLGDAFVLHALQVGAGSVGGAMDYAFARTPKLAGALDIVDPQSLEPPNAYRAILAPRALADAELEKAKVAEETFCDHSLDASGHVADVERWLATRPREAPLPLVLCAVDSADSRRAIQDCLPRELLNAACHPTEVTVSRHVTGQGPCVCCLHMEQVLDTRTIKARLIAGATGFNFDMVVMLMIKPAPLTDQHLRAIERHNGMPDGALQDHAGCTLEQLYDSRLQYGATPVETDGGGVIAVAAPWVTALAGFLLAGDALKHAVGQPLEAGTKLEEAAYASPEHRLVTHPPRWHGSECLCRSPRRARLIIERYGLSADEFEL